MYCPYVNCFFLFFCTVWSTLLRISLTKALVLWHLCCAADMERLGYVLNPCSLLEGTETLCPHATILNHRWLPGTRSRLLSVKPNEWMHLSPFYTRMHGEWLRYAKSTSQFHWHFLLKSEMIGLPGKSPMWSRHNVSSSHHQGTGVTNVT